MFVCFGTDECGWFGRWSAVGGSRGSGEYGVSGIRKVRGECLGRIELWGVGRKGPWGASYEATDLGQEAGLQARIGQMIEWWRRMVGLMRGGGWDSHWEVEGD